MKTAAPNRIVRFLPSLTDAAFLLPLMFLFLRLPGGSHLLADGDTGWHLPRAGMATVLAASILVLWGTCAILFRLLGSSVIHARHGWEPTLVADGVGTALLPVDAPFRGALKESQRWRPAFDDGIAIVFRSAQALASATAGEDARAFAAAGSAPDSRNNRGRETTKSNQRDLRITQPKTRSEFL